MPDEALSPQLETAPTPFSRAVDALKLPRVGASGRDIRVDALRGFAILLVVMGHSISNAENLLNPATWSSKYVVHNFLYTFHMPLFFLISGYVLFGKRIKVSDRAIRLLIPFVAWIPIYWFVNRFIHHFPWPVLFFKTMADTIQQPGAGLWFLPALFLCALLLVPAAWLENKRKWLPELYIVVAFVAVNLLWHVENFGVMQVKYFFAFVAAGYLIAKHRGAIARLGKRRLDLVLAVASGLFLALFFWLYYYGHIHPYAFPFSLFDLFSNPGGYLIRYLMAALGIIFAVAIIRLLGSSRALKVLAWFGLVTMEIYVAHGLMLQLSFGAGWVRVLVSFVTGIVLSLALAFLLLKQWWVTATLFYGDKPRLPGLAGEEGYVVDPSV